MGKTSQCAPHHDTILQLASRGWQRQDIAALLGLSTAAAQAYLQRRDQSPSPGSRRMLDPIRLRCMLEVEHLTQLQIAVELGCSQSCVGRTVASLHLKTARTGPRSGTGHKQQWSGGRHLDKNGYVLVHAPLHPHVRTGGYLPEHRVVMEVVLRRYLALGEVVGHGDNHPRHNWPENLQVFASIADHLRATLTGREKSSPRVSIAGAHLSSPKIDHCPGSDETLARCPSVLRAAIEHFLDAHRPGPEHVHLARATLLRQGARLPPFPGTSMV